MRQRFKILSHIVWAKPYGRWNGAKKEDLRTYFPSTERIIVCEHYGADGYAKGASKYHKVCADLKKKAFSPLIDYFKKAKERAEISSKAINEATGTKMCSHWFSYSQWKLPSGAQYKKLQDLFAQHGKNELNKQYTDLNYEGVALNAKYSGLLKQYDDLKEEYHRLRRPFKVSKCVPYTDVWHYSPVPFYLGKHPCEKPSEMMKDIINASSREGDVVFDAFLGSGSSGKAALALDRKFIGIEMDEGIFNETVKALQEVKSKVPEAA